MCNHETTLSVSDCCHADYSEEYEMCRECKEHCWTEQVCMDCWELTK